VTETDLVDTIEAIVVAGVAMTNASLSKARQAPELTFPQWRVLVVLGQQPDGMPVHQIARRIDVTLPATGRQLRRLEQRGLLVLEPDRSDRRVTRARLSGEGARVRASIMADRRAAIASALEGSVLDRGVIDALRRLAAALRQEDGQRGRHVDAEGPVEGQRTTG
jgi:DNA-binding MarR family transcriptional regulator